MTPFGIRNRIRRHVNLAIIVTTVIVVIVLPSMMHSAGTRTH